MKPILLKLSGLQSYREPQEIHFETLCEAGIFGIFGPTGSGKSTLLDAITLAMYGKVERAVNGTQGIMNHSEDSLFVSFTFELASASGAERYRVERRFKRVNELSVSNTVSRFIHVTAEGDQVIADKLADVTRTVEEKLGLKMDDFTRAVVLPQGKFAEFLSLKGSERRQMLQRLFHLERYGDQLAMKLSRRVKENDAELKSVEAEQQGLGMAGKEAVAEAEEALAAAKTHADAVRKQLTAVTERAEALGRMRELDLEKRRLENKLAELAAQEDEIRRLERQLELTGAAASMLPALETWREAERQWQSRREAAEALRVRAAEADKLAEEATAADEAAQAVLAAEEPKLVLRAEQLEQAAELQRARDALRAELAQLERQLGETRQQMDDVGGRLRKEQELLERGSKRREELQQQLKGLETRSGERQLLHAAMQRRQAVEAAEKQLSQAAIELKEQEERQKQLEAKRDRSAREEQLLQQQYIQLGKQANHCRSAAAAAGESIVQAEEAVRRLAAEWNAAQREKQRHLLSLQLAAELRDGEPCPVCGSLSHPHPAMASDGRGNEDEERRERLERVSEQLQEVRIRLTHLVNEAGLIAGGYGAEADADSLANAAHPLSPDLSQPAEEAAPALLANLGAECDVDQVELYAAAALAAVASIAKDIAECREAGEKVQRALLSCQQELAKETAAAESGSLLLSQLRERVRVLKGEVAEAIDAWAQENPELPLSEAEERFRRMQEKDAEAESVREGLERSVPFLEEKAQLVKHLEQEQRELEKRWIQGEAQRQSKSDVLKEKEERLHAWIGSQSAEQLLRECVAKLKSLKETAERAHHHRKTADETRAAAAKEAAVAQQAAESAEEHAKAARQRWDSLLESSPFATEAGVLEACLSAEDKERSEQRVAAHRDSQREWSLRLRDVEQKLGGVPFDEALWQQICLEQEQLRQADEAAIQARARAERDVEDLRKRNVRFMELEEQRAGLQLQGERLAKLQSCLRGNAFVEYIAEEQLMQVSQAASQRLRFLTKQRYSLEVDSGGGFVIRDDANGGVRRPVSTLSGGETFLTSLSLALALSAQIQLRGQYPLQFFFLDEGFGTLDPELLDTVITSLERLHSDKLTVGIISHVPELRARLPRKLIIQPAEQAGAGSQIRLEKM
ncbi:SMC family ATPase [Paenibacillus sp. FSL M8-0334]|uniref:SMC family ATPase n=1 Tax=Paenibacillus sp. FSL M8-0334 TaxID=2921623 RepID=UPI0030FA6698